MDYNMSIFLQELARIWTDHMHKYFKLLFPTIQFEREFISAELLYRIISYVLYPRLQFHTFNLWYETCEAQIHSVDSYTKIQRF